MCGETLRRKKAGYCIKHDGGHKDGVHPRALPFFYDGCPECLRKLAEGKTTRDAGPYRVPKSLVYRGVSALYNKSNNNKARQKAIAAAKVRAAQYSSNPEGQRVTVGKTTPVES